MKRLITIILLAIGLQSIGQVNWTPGVGAWQLKDTTGGKNVRFRSNTGVITPIITQPSLSDSLKNYARIQDGLISGGDATIGTGSVTIDTAYYRLRDTLRMSLPRTFTGISNSPTGTQYYLLVYGNSSGILDTISGPRDTIAVMPNNPANTVKINTVLVGDGGVESTLPDLSGYASLVEDNTFDGEQNYKRRINVYNYSGQSQITFRKTDGNQIGYMTTSVNPIDGGGIFQIGLGDGTGSTTVFLYGDLEKGKFFKRIEGIDPIDPQDFVTKSYGDTNYSGGGSSYTFTAPLTETGGVVSINTANTTTTGALTSTDWNTFNNKAPATGGTGYIQNRTGLQASSNFYISGTGRATNFGAGIAPNANHGYTGSASTATTTPFLMTPGVAYTGTQNGALHYVTADSTLRMMRFGSSDQVIFNNNNPSLKLSGLPRSVEANSSGGVAATKPIISILVTDSDVITAITGATYTSDRATITPASSKVMPTGQIYDDGTYTYIATAPNVVRRW